MLIISAKLLVVIFLSLFMPATAYSFIKFRLKKKSEEYANLLKLLKITHNDESTTPQVKKEYAPDDYVLPVVFSSLISFIACLFLMFGGELAVLSIGKGVDSVLLSGAGFGDGIENAAVYRRSIAVIIIAMMGGYLMAAQNVIRRLLTMDLSPGAYYSAGLRIVFAALVALIISFVLGDIIPSGMLSGIAFLTGVFPERGLKLLISKVKFFSDTNQLKSDDLPLEMIEGISYFHKIRLGELGIDNAQNLSEANFLDLVVKTSFPPNQILDWIGQAELYVSFKDDIAKLRDVGIRNIYGLIEAGKGESRLEKIAEQTFIPLLTLQIVYDKSHDDEQILLLDSFKIALNKIEIEK